MEKKVKVVMLPTKKASKLRLDNNGKLSFEQHIQGLYYNGLIHTYQNLYLVSDEEIKVRDWTINLNQIKNGHGGLTTIDNEIELKEYASRSEVVKVIATTDKSLSTVERKSDQEKEIVLLPQIPESFTKTYVEANGEIDEVLIEYEPMFPEAKGNVILPCGDKPKTREDNTIHIETVV